ncbi:MAG: mini-circle protein [Aeromicrobium sp.]|jgi:hypothetical protein|nr:mini-circle protein [Aeromicrobium sp.]
MARTDDIPERFDERSVLLQMLHYAQDTAVMKVGGLSEELARTAPLPVDDVIALYEEEAARHNGHLDILRELADGTTGD